MVPLPSLVAVLNAFDGGLLLLDAQGVILLCNRWFAERSDYDLDQIQGQHWLARFPQMGGGRVAEAIHSALHDNCPSVVSNVLNRAPFPLFSHHYLAGRPSYKRRIQQAIQTTPLSGDEGERYCLIQIEDVSSSVRREQVLDQVIMERRQVEHALAEANQELQQLAVRDSLTNLANRRYLDQFLDQEVSRSHRLAQPLSLVMLDIDHFKLFNDHYGHLEGDRCLQQVAQAIQSQVQRGSDLVARYGGEEFCVVLPDTTREAALALAERMRATVEDLAVAHARVPNQRITISLGITTGLAALGFDAPSLIDEADKALYQAKHSGRNTLCAFLSTDILACGPE